MKTKKIIEKKTGEKYASKKAMMKHEKSESKAEMKKEYGKPKPPTRQMTEDIGRGPVVKRGVKKPEAPTKMKVSAKKAPAKMKNC
jgi:hypothetical protein